MCGIVAALSLGQWHTLLRLAKVGLMETGPTTSCPCEMDGDGQPVYVEHHVSWC